MTEGMVLDLFAEAGGWDEALRTLGYAALGIENEPCACQTGQAADRDDLQQRTGRNDRGDAGGDRGGAGHGGRGHHGTGSEDGGGRSTPEQDSSIEHDNSISTVSGGTLRLTNREEPTRTLTHPM